MKEPMHFFFLMLNFTLIWGVADYVYHTGTMPFEIGVLTMLWIIADFCLITNLVNLDEFFIIKG